MTEYLFPKRQYSLKLINLAYPVVLGMISRTIMNLVDAGMVGRLGAVQLAATGIGAHVVMIFTFSYGSINIGVQALTARSYGEKNFSLCGKIVDRSLLVTVSLGILGAAVGYYFSAYLFELFTDDINVFETGKPYVAVRFLEIAAFAFIGIYRGFFAGIGITKINMLSMILMNLLNICLNYCLIFGNFGFPRLEVEGAGIASMISSFAGAGVMIWFSVLPKYRKPYSLYKNLIPDFEILKRLYRLSLPVIFQTFMVFTGFLIFLKILGLIGTYELAAGNVCIAIMSMSFMPGHGIGVAAATLVGQSLGANETDKAEKFGWEAVKIGVYLMGAFGIAFIFIPGYIMKIFTPDELIIGEGIIALRIIGFVQFFDAFGMILGNTLQSAGMTKFVMITEVSINWLIFLPLSYILGITLGWGTTGAWVSLAIYIFLFGMIMSITFIRGKWKTVKI
ncbi:MATE family efflux transporter [candidate division KSB1 bacterium]